MAETTFKLIKCRLQCQFSSQIYVMDIGHEYLKTAIKRLAYYRELGEKTFEQLDENDFHFQPNEYSNSIAVIIQHMNGNMLSRWTNFLTEDGEKSWRNRDVEFESQRQNKAVLIKLWNDGWDCVLDAWSNLESGDLQKTIYIRHEPLLIVDAINRQLAHYPHHVGQILYIGKMIKGAEWKSLSIEKGKSDAFNAEMKKAR